MTSQQILSEKPITLAELKKDIAKIKERDKELNFRSNKVEEYLNQFAKFDLKKGEELFGKLEKLKIPRLKEQHMAKIIDLMPVNLDDLKSALQGYTLTVTNDNMKKIVKALDEFR